eukprot:gene19479-21403_t
MGQVKKGHALGALIVGAMEIVFALIIMICSFVLGSKLKASATLTPYWAGIPYILPGILGIVTGVTKNSCAMIAFMVLNILCFIIMGVSAVLIIIVVSIYAAVSAHISKNCTYYASLKTCSCNINGTPRTYNGVSSCGVMSSVTALLYAIVIFCAFSAIASLAGSIIACAATCCNGGNAQPGAIIVQQPVVMQQQQQPPAYGQPQQQQEGYPVKA